jgi:phosphoenolpyruvate carboxylase
VSGSFIAGKTLYLLDKYNTLCFCYNELMKIPATMGTQHPDSASKYVPIQEEAQEAATALTPPPEGLGLEEFMIDFEGKMTPYHQTAEVVHLLLEKNLMPGRDVWLTPRISSATEETVFRQIMALMSIIEADYDLMRSSNDAGSIKEVILPMVRGAADLTALRRRIADVLDLAHKEFGLKKDPNSLQVIPLVEEVPQMVNFAGFFQDYYRLCQEQKFKVKRLRFMMARSDSAMIYGLVASVLAVKIMIATAYKTGDQLNLQVAPILGGGALPFRGHVRYENLTNLLTEFAGIRTVTIQSGLRYDHSQETVQKLAAQLRKVLPDSKPLVLHPEEFSFLKELIAYFSLAYMQKFSKVAPIVADLADIIPKQRDRLTERGPTGYARKTPNPYELVSFTKDEKTALALKKLKLPANIKLPRAITFTGVLYSIGLPPEFLGIGQALARIKERFGKEGIARFLSLYPSLKTDLKFASQFLALKVAQRFLNPDLIKSLQSELALTEELLEIELLNNSNQAYVTLMEIIEPLIRQKVKAQKIEVEDQALLKSCLVRLGKIRGSLG